MVRSGEAAFWREDYLGAIADWKHALDAGPGNPVLIMMLGQAYFAAGNYREGAAATQAAMHALPEDQWGVVVSNRSELYCHPKSYIRQLQELESAVNEHPKDPAARFLLAFHYAQLGYPQPAVAQLDKVVELEPRDEIAEQLRQALIPRLPDPGAPVITPGVVTAAGR
jgi:tetratricopeptide (TPR) repeat protein